MLWCAHVELGLKKSIHARNCFDYFTSFDKFRKAGVTPFILALLLFCWLICGGFLLVKGVTIIW